MKFGVVKFPGSNCDQDALYTLTDVFGVKAEYLWHKETDLRGADCVILPGGFSFGDYLRTGAVARFSPIMDAVVRHANRGGYVFGICNGFQVLCESGLLPGALVRNQGCHFVCKQTYLRVETANSAVTRSLKQGTVLKVPVAHGEGRFIAEADTLASLTESDSILFRYCGPSGEITDDGNPNGSVENIAGITNASRNVFGMMPHPERASEKLLGSADGAGLFLSLLERPVW